MLVVGAWSLVLLAAAASSGEVIGAWPWVLTTFVNDVVLGRWDGRETILL